jgi:hypothetical protein
MHLPTFNPMESRQKIVTLTLRNYWYESISKDEAHRRLSTRNKISEDERSMIEANLQNKIDHYISFDDHVFREYAGFENDVARLLLILQLRKRGDSTYEVFLPVYGSSHPDGRKQRFSGIITNEYKIANQKFVENGQIKDSLRFFGGPKEINLDVSFVEANIRDDVPESRSLRRAPVSCCRLCEIVHSILDVHWADNLCCLGGCGPIIE